MTQFANMDPALAINPGSAQVEAFLALDKDQPVVFVNLHEYHDRARYPSGYADAVMSPDVSGREAVIGRYPSRAAAMRMPGLPGYAQITVHRHAGLKAALTLALGPPALERLPR